MKNYDICKDVNEFYFGGFASFTLVLPGFFEKTSAEGAAIEEIKALIDGKDYAQASQRAEIYMQKYPHAAEAFLSWQIFAFWNEGKIPNAELFLYFTTMEEILPQEAFLNYDKALLHIKDKKFNDAAQELRKARSKDPNHKLSLALQFFLFYFSRDEQWKSLFQKVIESGILPQRITNLIASVESVKDRKQTPHYIFADEGDIAASNQALLKKFPALVIDKAPVKENVLMVVADSSYFRTFTSTLMLSALELKANNFGIHVHLYDPMGVDIEFLKQFDEQYPQLNLSFSHEKASLALETDKPSYYASMRFPRANEIFEKFPSIKKIAVVDTDILLKKNPFEHDEIRSGGIVVMSGGDAAPHWDQYAGGFCAFSRNDYAVQAFAYLSNILLKNFAAKNEFWFIDQVALFDMVKTFTPQGKITALSFESLFGKPLEFTDRVMFWTYTLDHKTRDNAMNRDRQRLVTQYGLPQDGHAIRMGKYGTVLIHKNDADTGTALLEKGTWRDREIKIARQLLNFGDAVLEIGAHTGAHTLPLAKHVGHTGRVYAVEKQRLAFQALCAQAAMNGLQNVYPVHAAVGADNGDAGGTKTVDSLGLASCTLIKIAAGSRAAADAIKGARETLKRLEPMIFFESHGKEVIEIAAFLKEFGYTVHDFGFSNDPLYLAVTAKYPDPPATFELTEVKS